MKLPTFCCILLLTWFGEVVSAGARLSLQIGTSDILSPPSRLTENRRVLRRPKFGYRVLLDNEQWLESGDTCVHIRKKSYCTSDKSLLQVGKYRIKEGLDGLGKYVKTSISWALFDSRKSNSTKELHDDVILITSFTQYDSKEVILFEQYYPKGLEDTQIPGPPKETKEELISSFPSFAVRKDATSNKKGYIFYRGNQAGAYGGISEWEGPIKGTGTSGSGPILLFNRHRALVISFASQFMSSSYAYSSSGELAYGIIGSVTFIPPKYSVATIITSQGALAPLDGIRKTMLHWGDSLMQLYPNSKKKRMAAKQDDLTSTYLGYSTDNGAYYYYFTEKGMDYEETMVKVKSEALRQKIPYRHWLMDSWWYYKGRGNGVRNWTAMESIFPNGATNLYGRLSWPVVAHNRYFAVDNVYAKENGGDFDFVLEYETWGGNGMSLPLEERFWDYLFSRSLKWGLYTYEQDWLHNVVDNMEYLAKNATAGRTWLTQMGSSAERFGLKIQYCMSYPRHLLQSIEIPVVTQARASDDYHPGNDQFRPLGLTTMLIDALALNPSKDNYWSNSTVQDHSKYGNFAHEPASRLQSLISTLSRGPVAPSDRAGFEDVALVMRSCAADGKLLRPDFPAALIDEVAFNRSRLHQTDESKTSVSGEVWTSTVDFGMTGLYKYKLLLAFESSGFEVSQSFLGLEAGIKYVAWEANSTSRVLPLADKKIQIPRSNSRLDFQYWLFAPVLPNGWSILGETETKWVPFSNDRFSNLVVDEEEASFDIKGMPNEELLLRFLNEDHMVISLRCRLPSSGALRMQLPFPTC